MYENHNVENYKYTYITRKFLIKSVFIYGEERGENFAMLLYEEITSLMKYKILRQFSNHLYYDKTHFYIFFTI